MEEKRKKGKEGEEGKEGKPEEGKGEKSGEDHSMTFLPELQKNNPNIQFFGTIGLYQQLG